MKAALLVMLSLVWGSQALAKGIICRFDKKLVDGSYRVVRLQERVDGNYDVFATESAKTPETKLAGELKCNLDGLVAFCYKPVGDSGEAKASFATFKIVEVTQLDSLDQKKAEKGKPTVSIEVSSLLTNEKKRYEFEAKSRYGGCLEE